MDGSFKTVLLKILLPIFIFGFVNFNIFLLCTSAHRFSFFTTTTDEFNVSVQTTGYGNRIVRCMRTGLNVSTETCENIDYAGRRFVEFGIYSRFIPLVLYIFMYFLICNANVHRRVHSKLRWMVYTVVVLFLIGDIIQLVGYLFYGFYLGSVFEFSVRDLQAGYIMSLVNILFCVILEWSYIGVKTARILRKRREGKMVDVEKVVCWSFTKCCLKHPDDLEERSPNYTQFTYDNLTIQEWLDLSPRSGATESTADVVKLFSYLQGDSKKTDEDGYPISKTELNIQSVEEIGNEKVMRTYETQKEIVVGQREGIHQNIVPLETYHKFMKPIETANWIERLLPDQAYLKHAVDRTVNEFYLFCHIPPERVADLKENGFDLSNFSMGVAGQAIYFCENPGIAKFAEHQGSLGHDKYTTVLARVLLGNYSLITSAKTYVDEFQASLGTTFDTVVMEHAGPTRHFAVKKAEHIYPEFVITYTKRTTSV